jgi:DNA primase
MARIPDDVVERLKREVRVEVLARQKGIALKRHGANLVGRCPFHDDRTPSFVVTPEKNLWHCLGACQVGGSVIDLVMRLEKCSFRLACELLLKEAPSLAASLDAERPRTTTAKLEEIARPDEPDAVVLGRVVDYYRATLKESPEALSYLESRGLVHPELIDTFKLGFANRTLGYRLPPGQVKAGAQLRAQLARLGVLRESGHEHFNGSLVVPVFDGEGAVVEMYGRKITPGLRAGTPQHLYLPGPHRGVFNRSVFQGSREIIVCEALLDALTFWCAGFRHVTSAYGVEGFTPELREAFGTHGIEKVLIAYDADEAGNKAAEKLAPELAALGMEVFRVQFPKGMDANAYAQSVKPAAKSLDAALRGAHWMAGTRPVNVPDALAGAERAREDVADEDDAASTPGPTPSLAADRADVRMHEDAAVKAEPEAEPERVAVPERAPQPTHGGGTASEVREDQVVFRFGDRTWRVRGLSKNLSVTQLKVTVLVARGEAFFVDQVELTSAKQRASFLGQASKELGVEERVVKSDLGRIFMELETLQDAAIQKALEPKQNPAVTMSESERAEALALLRDPALCARILADFDRAGVVGEETNTLTGYLATISRKLTAPLGVVIQSTSAAGKSSLMDAVLSFVPEEERVQYSAMTGQSLYYMGEADLQHKVLAIAEEEGASNASYALKLLQSEGELTIASTGKDPASGRLVTQEYRVTGPVMVMMTTTAIEVDEELLNRCVVLTVDDGRAQTRAIHQRQREAETLEGMLAASRRQSVMRLHQNAQRLLKPLTVVNPFAGELSFADHATRTRRDHKKYLTLIRTIALLHQHQREVKEASQDGATLRYIEATREDIAIADKLSREVLSRSMDELAPQTRRVLEAIAELVREEAEKQGIDACDVRFTQRDVRERVSLGGTQVKLHMRTLQELEYVAVHRSGHAQRFVYELLVAGVHGERDPFDRRYAHDENRSALSGDRFSCVMLMPCVNRSALTWGA